MAAFSVLGGPWTVPMGSTKKMQNAKNSVCKHMLRLGYYKEESLESGPKEVSKLGSHKYNRAFVVRSKLLFLYERWISLQVMNLTSGLIIYVKGECIISFYFLEYWITISLEER